MFCASAAGSTRKYFFSRLYYRKIFYKICYINNALHLEWIFITAGAARIAALLEWSGAKFSQSLVSSLYFFERDKCADNLILSLSEKLRLWTATFSFGLVISASRSLRAVLIFLVNFSIFLHIPRAFLFLVAKELLINSSNASHVHQ